MSPMMDLKDESQSIKKRKHLCSRMSNLSSKLICFFICIVFISFGNFNLLVNDVMSFTVDSFTHCRIPSFLEIVFVLLIKFVVQNSLKTHKIDDMAENVRKASHAGSWYIKTGALLSNQLDEWLSQADMTHGPARAIIAPHAGYEYSGECGSYAYKQISPVVVRIVFILGPSHHVGFASCALSTAETYETPLYDLHVDTRVNEELAKTGEFKWMHMDTDEREHSIEMHLPYIAKVMEKYKNQFTIVPILVGSLKPDREAYYGKVLAPYLADPKNLFIISSDFCHWGSRFKYVYFDQDYDISNSSIYECIEKLDREGMDIIESLNPTKFTSYIKEYENTICGRHPIAIFLQAIQEMLQKNSSQKMSLKFLKYVQSKRCETVYDSSVSYASAALVIE